tara:strand:+ start:2779 stop:3165 length:387 start_codon:yes stop_codon:yes gene_type:complete
MKKKILIVVSDYYKNISESLLNSAKKNLDKRITFKVVKVPGVFEIPVTISKNLKKYDGFIAIGCVIRGKTAHFDFISRSTIDGIMNISIYSKKPIGNCILTCFNYRQAILRLNKGKDAAVAVNSILFQ